MNPKVLPMIKSVEFSNDNTKLLHKNPTENGLTYYGIYQTMHPNWKGWRIIEAYLQLDEDWQEYLKTDDLINLNLALKKCSKILSGVSDLNKLVEEFYQKEFWDKMKLDLVTSEHKQLELMCFAINVGIIPAVKVLQETLNIKIDGIIGNQTINALNAFNEALFDKIFDLEEKEYYDELVENKPRFKIYQNGWKNRAVFI